MTKEECEIETSKAIMEMRNHIAELEKENAELKEGRPEWHKVADGDLPKTEELEMQVLCFTYDGYQLLSLFSDPKPIFKGYGVIAWCEIPKYTEEL